MIGMSPLRPIWIDPDVFELSLLQLDPRAFQSALPVQNYSLIFEDEAIGLAVGIWDTTTMQEAFGPYPGDEFITVLDGTFAILDGAGDAVTGTQGQSATFRNGIPLSWKQDGYLRKIYLTLQDPDGKSPDIAATDGGVIVLDPSRALEGHPNVDGVTCEVIFRNDAGTMTVTDCAYPSLTLPFAQTPNHRLVRVLQGAITLAGPTDPPDTYGAGTHVFLPRGTACAWSAEAGTCAFIVDITAV